MALPSGLQVDIEFTAGVWTNVSAYVSLRQGVSLKFGRTDSASAPQVATASLRLDNFDGRFTPKSSGSPYYPNVVPRKRLRVSYSSGASPRFVGYIKQWLPVMDGDQHYVVVQATDRLDVLSRSVLKNALRETLEGYGANAYFPLDDQGTIDITSSSNAGVLSELVSGTSVQIRNSGAGFSNGSATLGADPLRSAVDASTSLQMVQPYPSPVGGLASTSLVGALPTAISTDTVTLAAWLYVDTVTAPSFSDISVGLSDGVGSSMFAFLYVDGTYQFRASYKSGSGATAISPTATTALSPRVPYFVAVTANRSTATVTCYLNGVSLGSTVGGAQTAGQSFTQVTISDANASGPTQTARVSDIMVIPSVLTPAQVLDLYNASATGFAGELSGARITRQLGWVGLAAADYNIATGSVPMGPASTEGVSVTQAIQDVAETESGGAAVFVDVDGKVRFTDSAYRSSATPVMTLDAEGDLDDGSWQPVFDDLERVNDVTASRDGGASVRVTDAASIAALGTVAEDTTVNVYADENLLPWAQWRLNSTTPQFRIPQVSVDLMTAQTAGLYTALASTTIGSIVRISGLPATTTNPVAGGTAQVLPTTYVDGYVEGWSEQITADSYMVTFDLSPYIPRHIIANTTWGRLVETTGTMTLTSTIASGATPMSLTTSGSNPTLSTSAGDYPLYLKIDEEIVSVSSAPAGSASPQTLTITRAQLGTIAAAHTAGATVNVLAGALTI